MHFLTFADFQTQMQALYRQGEYQAALELATIEGENFPEQSHLIVYWRMAMASLSGNPLLAVALLDDLLATGFWFRDSLLTESPALAALSSRADYQALLARNRTLRQAEQNQRYPLLTLRSQGRCQAGGPPCPLLIGLHAGGSNAQDEVGFWSSAAAAGWLVGAPQSDQPLWQGAYTWEDREAAGTEVRRHLDALQARYAVDPARVVLAGHAQGAELAAWLALNGSVQTLGFIGFGAAGAWFDDLTPWNEILHAAQNRPLRGYLILGEEDTTAHAENVAAFVDMLNEVGIPCEMELTPLAGHDYDPAYESSLLRALEFIAGAG